MYIQNSNVTPYISLLTNAVLLSDDPIPLCTKEASPEVKNIKSSPDSLPTSPHFTSLGRLLLFSLNLTYRELLMYDVPNLMPLLNFTVVPNLSHCMNLQRTSSDV